jgi:sec-independent protein translocase protein TatA
MIPSIGPMEIIVVLVIALVIFGPRRIPAVGRSIGRGFRELKGGLSGDGEDEKASESS